MPIRLLYLLVSSTLLIPPVSTAAGQAGILQGVVVDSLGKPIARAQVFGGNPFRETQTGPDGRFRLARTEGRACSLEVIHRGSYAARQQFEPCPDTAIRIVLRRVTQSSSSFESLRDRCGTRANEPCTDRDGLRFIAISSGQSHSCGIASDHSAYCWGDGRNGQLGHGRREISRFPQRVRREIRFVSITAGGAFTCALSAEGLVFCWGNERTVPGWPTPSEGPVHVRLPEPASAITAGRRHACVLSADGRTSCWGWNVDGETGTGSSGIEQSMVSTPTPVVTNARFESLSAGFGFTCGVTTDRGVMCWGSNVDHVLGLTAPERCGDVAGVWCSSRPINVQLPEPITQVSSGTAHACALSDRGAVYCWGANASGQVGVIRSSVTSVPTPSLVDLSVVPDRVIALSSGGLQTCALSSAQLAYCWGADALGFGQNTTGDHAGPSLAAGGMRLRAISAGQVHTCALDTSNRLRCWGDTILGALGVR